MYFSAIGGGGRRSLAAGGGGATTITAGATIARGAGAVALPSA